VNSVTGSITAFSIAYGSPGETATTTAADGGYSFYNFSSGTYAVRRVSPAGWSAISPAGARSVNLTSGTSVPGQDFGDYENSTPRVINAPAISPNPPTAGTAATLSVLGADANGEANLTYTWSTLTKPTGSTSPTFSVNGTNAAKSSSVTFAASGTYALRVTIKNAAGTLVTSDLTFTVAAAPAPQVTAFVIDDGSTQCSMVRSLTLAFDQAVNLDSSKITLLLNNSPAPVTLAVSALAGNQYRVTFGGNGVSAGSLADGRYRLVLNGSQITNATGTPMASSPGYDFYRLFGDGDGSGVVDFNDFLILQNAFGKTSTTAGFASGLDGDSNDVIDFNDFLMLQNQFGKTLPQLASIVTPTTQTPTAPTGRIQGPKKHVRHAPLKADSSRLSYRPADHRRRG
jgi:hypothetical protein